MESSSKFLDKWFALMSALFCNDSDKLCFALNHFLKTTDITDKSVLCIWMIINKEEKIKSHLNGDDLQGQASDGAGHLEI